MLMKTKIVIVESGPNMTLSSNSIQSVFATGDERPCRVECLRVASFSFDEMGRLNVEKIAGSNHIISCDTVIFSVGQRAGLAFIPDDAGVGLTATKTIAINLPNDEAVQLAKGTRRLQLKNAMLAKYNQILVPISEVLIAEDQRPHVEFDAFFANVMFYPLGMSMALNTSIVPLPETPAPLAHPAPIS